MRNSRTEIEHDYWETISKDKKWNMINDFIPTSEDIAKLIQEHIDDKTKVVLEIGCGYGRIMKELAVRNPDIQFWGSDIQSEIFKYFDSYCLGVDNIKGRFLCDGRLISGNQKIQANYDLIYSVTVFQHIDDRGVQEYLKNIRKRMKKNTKLIIQFVEGEEKIAFSWQRNIEEIKQFANNAKLEIVSVQKELHDQWLWVYFTKVI